MFSSSSCICHGCAPTLYLEHCLENINNHATIIPQALVSTFRCCHHCYNFQADILLHCKSKISEGRDDLCDLLDHGAHVLSELVHGDWLAHHGGQAGLQGHQVGGNLIKSRDRTSKINKLDCCVGYLLVGLHRGSIRVC